MSWFAKKKFDRQIQREQELDQKLRDMEVKVAYEKKRYDVVKKEKEYSKMRKEYDKTYPAFRETKAIGNNLDSAFGVPKKKGKKNPVQVFTGRGIF